MASVDGCKRLPSEETPQVMKEGKVMNYRSACRAVRVLGMDIVDGLALTFSCADYPAWVRDMNGWPVEHVAEAAAKSAQAAPRMNKRHGG